MLEKISKRIRLPARQPLMFSVRYGCLLRTPSRISITNQSVSLKNLYRPQICLEGFILISYFHLKFFDRHPHRHQDRFRHLFLTPAHRRVQISARHKKKESKAKGKCHLPSTLILAPFSLKSAL